MAELKKQVRQNKQAHVRKVQGRGERRDSIMYAIKRALKAQHVNVPPCALSLLERALNPRRYYQIEVIRDPLKAAERLLLRNYETASVGNDDRSDGMLEQAQCIYGKITKYGMRYFHRSIVDGYMQEYHEYDYPRFMTRKIFIAIIKRCKWVKKAGKTRSKETAAIIIYAPDPKSKIVDALNEDVVCDVEFDYESPTAPVVSRLTVERVKS